MAEKEGYEPDSHTKEFLTNFAAQTAAEIEGEEPDWTPLPELLDYEPAEFPAQLKKTNDIQLGGFLEGDAVETPKNLTITISTASNLPKKPQQVYFARRSNSPEELNSRFKD